MAELSMVTQPERLRPAQLQARLRAGDTPEQLAKISDVSIETIRRLEAPITAERDHVINQVQQVQASGAGSVRAIGTLVSSRLGARGIVVDRDNWTARRDPGSPWLIELRYDDGARAKSARWTFDLTKRHLTALDDEAKWLSGPQEPDSGTTPIPLRRARKPVGGTASLGMVSGAPNPIAPAHYDAAESGDAELVELTPAGPGDVGEADDADELAGIVPIKRWREEKIDTVAIPVAIASAHPAKAAARAKADSAGARASNKAGGGARRPSQVTDLLGNQAELPNPAPARPKGRAKVPSWDEIVFGSKTDG